MNQFTMFAQTEAAPAAVETTTQTTAPEAAVPASDVAQQPRQGNPLISFAPFIILIGLFIYLSWRGQKKEAKRQQDMINSIRKDTKVMTTGGLIGTVAEVKDDCYLIMFAPNVKITVARNAISKVISNPDTPVAEDESK